MTTTAPRRHLRQIPISRSVHLSQLTAQHIALLRSHCVGVANVFEDAIRLDAIGDTVVYAAITSMYPGRAGESVTWDANDSGAMSSVTIALDADADRAAADVRYVAKGALQIWADYAAMTAA